MKLQLIKILAIHIVSITLCIATRYDCDKRNVSCGCAFKHVEINEENNNPEEAIPYSWSMAVSIRYDCHRNGNTSTHCCGGTILNDRYILTAARCFDPTDNSSLVSGNITIAASVHSLSQNCQTIRVVDDIFIHPNWTTIDEAMHNIAILRLAEPLDFHTDFIISPACFPSRMNTAVEMMPNTTLAVVGWSVFSNSGNNTDQVLQQLIVYPIDYNDSFCARSVDDSELLFCAGRDGAACFPEVGGPLFQWIENRWELVGIESYAIDGCPRIGYKGLFVRVAAYYDWIDSIVNGDNMITSSTESITTEQDIGTVKPSFIYKCNRSISCGCGYSDVTFRPTRIVGGEDVIEHSWSMIVSLRFYGSEEHSCAGTLLSNSFVLTAAHCVDFFSSANPVNITIVAGVTNRSDSDNYQRNIDRIYVHENYTDRPYFLNNIALLHMDRPLNFQFNPVLAKTCLNYSINSSISIDEQHPKNGTPLVVIGWGAMRPGSFLLSEYLKQIQVNTIDNEDQICKDAISNSELQFCAGLHQGEKDGCLGDAGGPILQWTGHYWEQVGIIGHSFNCGRPGHPGIYTRLSYYWQWMEDILNKTNEHLEPQIPSPLSITTMSSRPSMTTSTRIPQTTHYAASISPITSAFTKFSSLMITTPGTARTMTDATSALHRTLNTNISQMTITTPGTAQTMAGATSALHRTLNTNIPQTMITTSATAKIMTGATSALQRTLKTNIPRTMITTPGTAQIMTDATSALQRTVNTNTSQTMITTPGKAQTMTDATIALQRTLNTNIPQTMITTPGTAQTMTDATSALQRTLNTNTPQTMITTPGTAQTMNDATSALQRTLNTNIPQTMITTPGKAQTMTDATSALQRTVNTNIPQTMITTPGKAQTMTDATSALRRTLNTNIPQTMITTSGTAKIMTDATSELQRTLNTNIPQTMMTTRRTTSAATSSVFSRKTLLFRSFSAFFLSFLLSSFFSAF